MQLELNKIIMTRHVAERLQERFDVHVREQQTVSIRTAYFETITNYKTRKINELHFAKINKKLALFILDFDTKQNAYVGVTVYVEGDYFDAKVREAKNKL